MSLYDQICTIENDAIEFCTFKADLDDSIDTKATLENVRGQFKHVKRLPRATRIHYVENINFVRIFKGCSVKVQPAAHVYNWQAYMRYDR